MHPRSRHAGRYDFAALTRAVPDLAAFVTRSPRQEPTIDFADPAAVRVLNRALLKTCYGVEHWDLPPGFLCPPVPGRADYVHYAADLLAADAGGAVPRGDAVTVLDVGVGANCIYAIVGRAEYGWRFVGTDIDAEALANARKIVDANAALSGGVELRAQTPPAILTGVIKPEDRFDLTLCNPPFHASAKEARAVAERKWEKLNRRDAGKNFGGRDAELWTPGGEAAFVWRLITESAAFGAQVRWFTTLLSQASHLPGVMKTLERANAAETRVVEMSSGQKKTRLVAWTFLDKPRRGRA